MEHFCYESNARGFCGIFSSKLKLQFEQTTFPCSFLRALNESSPIVKVSFVRRSINAFISFFTELLQITNKSFFCWIVHVTIIIIELSNYIKCVKIQMKQSLSNEQRALRKRLHSSLILIQILCLNIQYFYFYFCIFYIKSSFLLLVLSTTQNCYCIQIFIKLTSNLSFQLNHIFNILSKMLILKEQKHLVIFDSKQQYFASYYFAIKKPILQSRDNHSQITFREAITKSAITFKIKINSSFSFEWQSQFLNLTLLSSKENYFGPCPFSLETYLEIYSDPKIYEFELSLKQNFEDEDLWDTNLGKLIIKTSFKGNPFLLPVSILDYSLSDQKTKKVNIVSNNEAKYTIICSGKLIETTIYQDVVNFISPQGEPIPKSFKSEIYEISGRVDSANICIALGKFKSKQFQFDKYIIRILSDEQDIFFMPTLAQVLQSVKSMMGEFQSLTIIQNMESDIEDAHKIVFYTDLSSFQSKIFRSLLYDKIKDKWLIEGIVNYNRSNKHFQDVMKDLIELITEGQEVETLSEQTFSFDEVWQTKAIFFYHVLSNFKSVRDYGSASLANLIIEEAKKNKINSSNLFKKLKNKYGLKNFRTNYEHQFLKSTGINRIFYQLIDVRRQNRVKIIVRQKSLANKIFRQYNMFRIRLQHQYDLKSELMNRIIDKNHFLDNNNKKRDLSGPLAVPSILKCLPYFKGSVAVETDASDMPFQLQLKEENIIEQKQNATSRVRAPIRKLGEGQRNNDGYNWMMIDTAHIFPAVYKNQNVHESVILQKIKRRYESEKQEIKVLNCISKGDHSESQKICRALLQKIKINPNLKQNCSINVKRKVLQLLPIFLSKAKDFHLWQDFLALLKLYEPTCHDFSQQGFYFLLSLIESVGQFQYKKAFNYYFQHFHRILLAILREANSKSQDKEEKLKIKIFNSLLKWNSKYSYEILKQVKDFLIISQKNTRHNLQVLKVICKNIFTYLQNLKIKKSETIFHQITNLLNSVVSKDKTYELFAIQFQFTSRLKQKQLPTLQFLKYIFDFLEKLQEQNIKKYGKALRAFKNILNSNRKVYGLEFQLSAEQNHNYFLAQYLWNQLTCKQTSENHFIRLQWIKIYRIFYFYYIPISTLQKLHKNIKTQQFSGLDEALTKEVITNLRDFIPDIKWFSGYDSRSSKDLKAKYELMNQNKRKKKIQNYTFSQNNIITSFLKTHPGRDSWDELARQAIRICIYIYGEKEQNSEGAQMERFKRIEQNFKKVEQKLKRGRMPNFYNYKQLKTQIFEMLDTFQQKQQRVYDIFKMIDNVLEEIATQKSKRQNQMKNQTKIVINLEVLEEQNEEQDQNQVGEGYGQNYLFEEEHEHSGYGQENLFDDGEGNHQSYHEIKADKDEDLLIFNEQ